MSLKSTYTNASIRGWTGSGSTTDYPWSLSQTLSSSATTGFSELSLSTDNTYFVTGTNSLNTKIYSKTTTWAPLQTLTFSRSGTFQIDSASISSNGNYVAVGQLYAGTPEVYIFYKGSLPYTQQQLISGSGLFGVEVSLNDNGDYLAISDISTSSGPYVNVGTVYMYNRVGTTWSLQATITPPTPSTSLEFGFTTSMNPAGNILVIGARDVAGAIGYTYIYTRTGSTWSLQQTLTGGGHQNKIDASGTYIIASSNSFDTVILFSYNGSTWSQNTTFTNPGSSTGFWGSGVTLSDNATVLVIGDPGYSSTQGALYIYVKTGSTWYLVQTIIVTASIGQYGFNIQISDNSNTIMAPRLTSIDNIFVYTTSLFN